MALVMNNLFTTIYFKLMMSPLNPMMILSIKSLLAITPLLFHLLETVLLSNKMRKPYLFLPPLTLSVKTVLSARCVELTTGLYTGIVKKERELGCMA